MMVGAQKSEIGYFLILLVSATGVLRTSYYITVWNDRYSVQYA